MLRELFHGRLELPHRFFIRKRALHGGLRVGLRVDDALAAFVLQGGKRDFIFLPKPIECGVLRDGEYPRPEGFLHVEFFKVLPGLDECFLCDVGSVLFAPGELSRERIDERKIAPEELFERGLVTREILLYELFVGTHLYNVHNSMRVVAIFASVSF